MKRFSICFLLILFTYPCVAFGQQAPSSTGEIYGTVYQVNPEQPVASVQIRIVETNQRAPEPIRTANFDSPTCHPGSIHSPPPLPVISLRRMSLPL